jgi:DNA-binding NarL/FixJ family response regulator
VPRNGFLTGDFASKHERGRNIVHSQVEVRPITVLLVDDHAMVAESFRRVLVATGDFDVVGVAATVAQATALAVDRRPDVILMDYRLPDGDGVTAARAILALLPDTKVLILSGGEYSRVPFDAVAAGCVGYLDKTGAVEKLVAAVHAAAAGEVVLSAGELRLIAANHKASGVASTRLTRREQEILDLLGEGLANQAIAERLTLSLNTVRTHVQTVLTKLGAHSKLEAVALATKSGLLTPS